MSFLAFILSLCCGSAPIPQKNYNEASVVYIKYVRARYESDSDEENDENSTPRQV